MIIKLKWSYGEDDGFILGKTSIGHISLIRRMYLTTRSRY